MKTTTPRERLENAVALAEHWFKRSGALASDRYADTLANAKGTLKPGGAATGPQLDSLAETLEFAAGVWRKRSEQLHAGTAATLATIRAIKR